MVAIVSGPSGVSASFARGVCRVLGCSVVESSLRVFPDGEVVARISDSGFEGDTVVVIHSLTRPQDRRLLELAMLVEASKGLGAGRVIALPPYTAFARQDSRFLPGEPVTISIVLKALYAAGADVFATIEIHKEWSLRYFPGKAYNISPYKYMAESIGLSRDILVLAPDKGALDRARRLASSIGAEYDYLVKYRDRVTGEISIQPRTVNARGRDVLIIDDIISTGGTVARATERLLEAGASSVRVLVAHLLGLEGSLDKLRRSGVSRVYAANTLERVEDSLVEYIDVTPLTAGFLREIT